MSSDSANSNLQSQNPDTRTLESEPEFLSDPSTEERENANEEEQEEEGECAFCLFMKGGGCKDEFIAWEKCVEEGEKNNEDIVEKCFEITSNLRKCMQAHSDYYEPILSAEKAAEDELSKELQKDKDGEEKQNAETVEIEVEVDDKKR